MKKTQAVRAVAASQYPREVDDAIAFLRSMLSLAEARGWTTVTEYFAGATLGMALEILGPDKDGLIEDARDAIDAAGAFIEELRPPLLRGGVPISVLKGVVAMIETAIRTARGGPVETATDTAA